MGFQMAVAAWKKRIRLPQPGENEQSLSARRLVALGIIATITNPFWYAWWVTVAAGYLAQAATLPAISAFFLGHIAADYAWDTTLSAIVGGGRRWMTDRIYQGLMLACGVFFVYLGIVFLFQASRSIFALIS
jgi:threonine/homoserine/homoserine lactone efflux protein